MDDITFIKSSEQKLNEIINSLGWSLSYFQNKVPTMVSCPHNTAHRMPPDKLSSHLETCEWLSAGYPKNEKPLPLGDSSASSVLLTPNLQEEIITKAALQDPTFKRADLAGNNAAPRPIPMSSNRLMQQFTSDERRAIYDYVVTNTESNVKIALPDVMVPLKSEEKRELTKLEILAAERDAKRRRATYRNKVHTNRKTHVEIMREVIDSQMNCLINDPNARSEEPNDERKEESRKERSAERGEKYLKKRDSRDERYATSSRDHYKDRSRHRSRSNLRRSKDRHYHRSNSRSHHFKSYYVGRERLTDDIKLESKSQEDDFGLEYIDQKRSEKYEKDYIRTDQLNRQGSSKDRRDTSRSRDLKEHHKRPQSHNEESSSRSEHDREKMISNLPDYRAEFEYIKALIEKEQKEEKLVKSKKNKHKKSKKKKKKKKKHKKSSSSSSSDSD